MADIITPVAPVTTVQKERRCSHAVCSNDLGYAGSNPAEKYGISLVRWDEPQDASGKQTGPRERVGDKALPMAEVLTRNFTANGVTLPGAAILALVNEIIDTYKGDA